MIKFVTFFILAFALVSVCLADTELPLPGPGSPPSQGPGSPPPQGPESSTYTIGSGQVGRFKERSFIFSIPSNLNRIRGLRVTCTHQKIKIKNITVQFADGEVSEQTDLLGTLSLGEFRISYLPGKAVAVITVVASSSSLFRKDGVFMLDATTANAYSGTGL